MNYSGILHSLSSTLSLFNFSGHLPLRPITIIYRSDVFPNIVYFKSFLTLRLPIYIFESLPQRSTQLFSTTMAKFSFSSTSPYKWLALYFVLNLFLTLYNKVILMDFRYPWTLTAVHTFCSAIGATTLWLRGSFTPTKLSYQENVVMLAISVLYTINIAISNVSL